MMQEKNSEIGERLRFIRGIFNEGSKLSASQFAHILNETVHKILNYENGRASISPELLISLYRRGVNPIFILTGEGTIFAPNEEGQRFAEHLRGKIPQSFFEQSSEGNALDFNQIKLLSNANEIKSIDKIIEGKKVVELLNLAHQFTAVAGDIMRFLEEKENESKQQK